MMKNLRQKGKGITNDEQGTSNVEVFYNFIIHHSLFLIRNSVVALQGFEP